MIKMKNFISQFIAVGIRRKTSWNHFSLKCWKVDYFDYYFASEKRLVRGLLFRFEPVRSLKERTNERVPWDRRTGKRATKTRGELESQTLKGFLTPLFSAHNHSCVYLYANSRFPARGGLSWANSLVDNYYHYYYYSKIDNRRIEAGRSWHFRRQIVRFIWTARWINDENNMIKKRFDIRITVNNLSSIVS